MYRYAQIDMESGIVVSDSYLSGEVNYPHMVPIADDFDLTNKKYINGEWIGYVPEIIEPDITQLDAVEENQLVIMEAMAEQYEESIENRINDMEVQAVIYETLLEMQEGM